MIKTFSVEELPNEMKQKAIYACTRAERCIKYGGLRQTAKDIGISVNTLQKIIYMDAVTIPVWEKLISWQTTKWYI